MSESRVDPIFNPAGQNQKPPLFERIRSHKWWRIESALIAGAMLTGILSSLLSQANSQAQARVLQERYATQPVLTVAKDLYFGQTISRDSFMLKSILKSNLTPNHIAPKEASTIIGKKIALDLKKGDPLLLSSIQGIKEASSMADKVPPGSRLFTLTISDLAANHGFIRPNNHVDILAHIDLPDRGLTTFTLLEDITVVSIGESSVINDSGRSSGTDASFFAKAKDIEMLAFAQKRGEFSLSLRNSIDMAVKKKTKGIDLNEFLDHEGINKASGGGELQVYKNGKKLSEKESKNED